MMIASRVTDVCVVAATLPLLLAPNAEAATIHCGAGDVQCLIAALNEASADPQHKTTIRLAGGTYALMDVDNNIDGPNGLPLIVSTVTIDGGANGSTLTAASGAPFLSRILYISASGRLTLRRVTITNPTGAALANNHGVAIIGDSTFTGSHGGVFSDGGAVDITRTLFEHNSAFVAGGLLSRGADVRITESRFSQNSANLGVGGILLNGGTASISATTLDGNFGDCCGAMIADSVSTLVIRDSAFVENASLGDSAGVRFLGGTADVINTTFARNSSSFLSAPGVAIRNVGGSMTVLNSTFAENQPGFVAVAGSVIASDPGATTLLENTILVHDSDDLSVLCGGAVTSLGNNVIDDPSSSCNVTVSDLTGDAGLGQLVDDGTPGNAHYPLLPDSQAVDAANDDACLKKDQLGRPRAPRCDIGAVEFRREGAKSRAMIDD
jgi:hypothetical protein